MNSLKSKSVDVDLQRTNQKKDNNVQFRWAAEFLAGPGGYLEKAEVVSKWFQTLDEAKEHAQKNSAQEVNEYPYSRGTILKLMVEDNAGKVIELSNVKSTRERYM